MTFAILKKRSYLHYNPLAGYNHYKRGRQRRHTNAKEGSLMNNVRNYVVKDKEIFVGLEDSKRTWKISVRSEGMEVHFGSMPARYTVLQQYLIKRFPGCRIKLVYEASFRGFWLHDLLVADGIECIVAPPSRITHERKRSIKNDTVDARRLATVLEKQDVKACFIPDRERREDRQINRTLQGLQKDMVRIQNRIRKLFDMHGVGEDLPAGNWNVGHYQEARIRELPPSLDLVRNTLFHTLDQYQASAKKLLAKLRELSRNKRYGNAVSLLSSCPGVGWLTAIRIVLEWGEDWSRFKSSRSIGCYSGLICSDYTTGEHERKGRITGDSNPHVRSWLIQCAWTSIRKDPVMLDKYQRVYKSSGSKKKAIVAVAHKLVVRMRALLLHREPYCIGLVA